MVREDLKTRFPALFWKTSSVDVAGKKRASVPLRYRISVCKSLPVVLPDEDWDDDLENHLSGATEKVVLKLELAGDFEKLSALLVALAADGDEKAASELVTMINANKLHGTPEAAAVLAQLAMDLGQPLAKEMLDDLEL